MSLVKSTVALYNKYKKELVLLILVFFAYNIFIYYNQMKEGLVGATSCTQFTNCSQCVNGQVNNSNSPCYWSNQEKNVVLLEIQDILVIVLDLQINAMLFQTVKHALILVVFGETLIKNVAQRLRLVTVKYVLDLILIRIVPSVKYALN